VNLLRLSRPGASVALLLMVLVVAGGQSSAACGGTSGATSTPPGAAAASAPATPSPAAAGPGTIAFTRASLGAAGGDLVGESGDLCVVRSDGSGLRRLAHGSGHRFIRGGVAWSPDGSRIAFVRGQAFDRAGVWVMDADGSGQRLVTRSEKALGPGLAWSPGPQLVFSNLERGDVLALLAVNADGSGLRHVTPAGKPVTLDELPAWAPDGRIYFDREDADSSAICSVRADGSGLTRVTAAPQPTSFSLSPDGKWLLLWDRTREALVRLPAGGEGEEVVLVDELARYIPRLDAVASSWSPDGTRIAFAADGSRWSMPSALYIVNADGSGLREVPNTGKGWNPVWRPR
jgi:Tol biopolymer transport system component